MNIKRSFCVLCLIFSIHNLCFSGASQKEITTFPGEEIVSFVSSEGKIINASVFYPSDYISNRPGLIISSAAFQANTRKYPAIILLPMWNENRYGYLPLIAPLQDAGFVLLAIDYSKDTQEKQFFSHYKYLKERIRDTSAAYDFIQQLNLVDHDNISIIGASIGSTAGIQLCAQINSNSKHKPIRSLVLVSPAINYFGIYVNDNINDCRTTTLLFVLEKQDPSLKDNHIFVSGQRLYKTFKGQKRLTICDGAGHGTKMLLQKNVSNSIVGWLKNPL